VVMGYHWEETLETNTDNCGPQSGKNTCFGVRHCGLSGRQGLFSVSKGSGNILFMETLSPPASAVQSDLVELPPLVVHLLPSIDLGSHKALILSSSKRTYQ
jgi:hypothetical protein